MSTDRKVLEVLRKGNLQQNDARLHARATRMLFALYRLIEGVSLLICGCCLWQGQIEISKHQDSVECLCDTCSYQLVAPQECDWENALEHLQYCLAGSVQLNEACYNAAVHACRKDWQRALCFLSSMCSLSLRSSRTSCNSLLHASTVTTGAPSSLHQWALALSQLTGFAKMQIRSDSYTLTTIGAACALNKVGQKQWQHAYLFHRFHKGQRNVFSHNSLLCACERASCWEMVVAMVMDPSAPVSTVISFNTAIAASSAAHGNWRHGLCMFVAIATFELSRSISSYNALAAGLRRMLCWRQSCCSQQNLETRFSTGLARVLLGDAKVGFSLGFEPKRCSGARCSEHVKRRHLA
ncbi:unnamed protein product [Symbiodinium microadriaticum]|nr:unnamed protein product [Symbiodinium microadriaticum]